MTDLKKIPPRCEFDQNIATVKLDELIPSDTRLIEGVVSRVVRLIGESACPQDSENVELALQEALMNAILHGNRNDPEKYVRICVAVEEGGGILIVVKDCGPGFDPSAVPNPTLRENIYREGGRGLYLISQLMDEVQYKFENGTAVYMRRYPPDRRT
jgi:serine/threonine-protein kinase RsbW